MDFKYMMFYYTPLNLEDFKETSFDPELGTPQQVLWYSS